jgi:hypothetical protein
VRDSIRRIADTVLYEGYVLWPYRRSALKNQRRWTFGGVYPPAHSAEHPDDPSAMQTECLVEGDGMLEVTVRFLHVVQRGLLDASGTAVEELEVDGEQFVAWEEAREREVFVAGPLGADLWAPIAVAEGSDDEELGAGRFVRTWTGLSGAVEVSAVGLAPGLRRLTVRVLNTSGLPPDADRQAALAHTFCSTHAVLRAAGAAFVSLTDPPQALREAAEACANVGTWPVLVGEAGARDTLLASPMILPDYPQVAAESPGDLFDGGEIDQLLTLSILSMTDEEKAEMRAADPRTREILVRTEALSQEELLRLHGRWR